MKNARLAKLLVVIALLIINSTQVPASAQLSDSALQPKTMRIGALLSLSGGLEQWCGYIRQGIELAASEDSLVKTKIIIEDDQSLNRKASVSAAQKLVEIDKVDLLYSWTASAPDFLRPIARQSHVPLLIGAYDQRVENGGPYVFGAFVNMLITPREIARFFVQKKHAQRLALIMAADDWSQSFEVPFKDEAKKLGAQVVLTEMVSTDEPDLRRLITKLKTQKIDAVLAPLFSNSLYSFLRQARELHYTGVIHVGDGMFEEDLKVAGESAEGVYSSQIWLNSPELVGKLKQKFGGDFNPLQLGLVASGYDWVKHLQGLGAKLVWEGKEINRANIKNALGSFASEGFLGRQMYGAPPATSGEIIVVAHNGKYVPIDQ